jgi:predicted nucleotide-binding protein
MNECQLSEEQKILLKAIVPGLKSGIVKTEWTLVSGDNRIMSIFGLDDDGSLWRNHWEKVQYSDFDDFAECGLFRLKAKNSYGIPTNYSLHKQRIIELVESNFGVSMPEENQKTISASVKDPKAVFVVHGRNSALRSAMFEFLRALELHPLEWDELISRTRKSAPYIGEILDVAFSEAQAIIILMTPDDIAQLRPQFQQDVDELHEKNLTPQARPNVLFEAGIAMGRSPERTILVEIGKLRPFSDVAGRHVIRLDGSTQKRQQLAQRLADAGCEVNMKGTDWHSVGKFDLDTQLTLEELVSNQWGKSGDIWWLQGDLIATIYRLNNETKYLIDDGLQRCFFHASRLNMTDKDIVDILKFIKNEARQ